jgi:hypothetical protein
MTAPRPILPRAMLRRMLAVLAAPDDGFVALVRVADLDPGRDFRGAVDRRSDRVRLLRCRPDGR